MPDATPTPQPAVEVETRPAAAGRMSLKAMVVSLLVIALGVAGGLFYILVGPILAEERFIKELEGKGAKIERRTDPPEDVSDWLRKQLGFPGVVDDYEGPLGWDREDDDLAGRTFRRLASFKEIQPGEKKAAESPLLDFFASSSLTIKSELEDDRLRWLGSLQKIDTLNLNARKLSGDFLARLNRAKLNTLTLKGANTNNSWAEGLRFCGRLYILSVVDSRIDPETAGAIFGMDAMEGLELNNTEFQWPATLDVSKSIIKTVSLRNMKMDRRLMGTLGGLHNLDSLLIWDTSIEPGYFSGLEDAKKGPIRLVLFKGRVRGDALSSLKGNQTIRDISFMKAEIDPEAIQGLAVLPSLESLRLNGPGVDGRVVAHVLKIPPPKHLSLDTSALTDAGFEELIRQGKFQSLDITKTKVTAKGLEALLEPRSLKELSLDAKMVTPSLKMRIQAANPDLKLEIEGGSDEEEDKEEKEAAP